MTATELLAHLAQLDVQVWPEGESLRFNAPAGVMTAALRARMAAHKSEILSRLRAVEPAAEPAGPPPLVPLARGPRVPASFPQRRLWFLDRLYPGAVVYNIPYALDHGGPLDPRALERGLGELVRRHQSLRTTFEAPGGEPEQVIAPPRPFRLSVVDLVALVPEARQACAAHLLRVDARRPFDLGRGPLFRAALVRLEPTHHRFLMSVHHVVADNWSVNLLNGELAALYRAFSRGVASPLPEPALQYPDFACWQRAWLQGEALERELAYWRERLAGELPVLDLPADRPRLPVLSYRGATLGMPLPAGLLPALDELSRSERVTLFVTLLAAFDLLLLRHTGQPDLLVGTPVANRNRQQLETVVGFFANTLVLRTDLSGEPTFRELLARVRDTVVEAFARQDMPFEKLVEELRPERNQAHSPLFQVMFILQNMPEVAELTPPAGSNGDGAAGGGGPVRWIDTDTGTAKFDLTLSLAPSGGSLIGLWEYSTDLFDRTTVRRFARRFAVLLEAIAEDPDRRLSELPLLTAAERQQLVAEWNDTAVRWPGPAHLVDAFAAQAARTPDAVAVVFADERLSYGELDRRAGRVARHLVGLGATPGSLVAVCLDRGLDLLPALLGILRAGGAYLPLDPSYPQQRLGFMLSDSGARLLVAHSRHAGLFGGWDGAALYLDRDAPLGGAGERLPASRAGGELAYVIYTSGSTGRPKGVGVPHGALTSFLASMRREPGCGPGDRLLAVTSLSFDIAGLELYLPLISGGQVVVASRDEAADGRALAVRLAESRATVLQATPVTWRLLLAAGWDGCSRLKALCGGEALPSSLAAQLLPRVGELWNLYGPTETTIWSAAWRVRGVEEGVVAIGRPIANTELAVVDGALNLMPMGAVGEVVIGGQGVARGYVGRAAMTAIRFVPDALSGRPGGQVYRTGDLGRQRPDGVLEYLGRRDHQVKVRGLRIELGEIESALEAEPGVRQAVALVLEPGEEQARLVAFVVREPAAAAPEELREALRRRLPEHMVPGRVVALEGMPLTPNGKVDREALRRLDDRAGAGSGIAPEPAAPCTPVEAAVAAIWSEVLGGVPVGVHDDFFALGGHSLLAMRVLARIFATLGVELSVRVLFEAPTVARLAERVETELGRGAAARGPSLVRIGRTDDVPLSFAQQRLWFLDRFDPAGSGLYNIPVAVRLRQPLAPELLRRSLEQVVHRHETLRTRVALRDDTPVQAIAEEVPVELPLVDLTGLAPARREAEALRLASPEGTRPFTLARAPLWRARLLRLGDGDQVVLLTLHHLVADDWSMAVLVEEVTTLYAAFSAGRPGSLPELAVQYSDYAIWQRQWLAGEVLEELLGYWRGRLAGLPGPLELPLDRPRPPVQSFRGRRLRRPMPARLAQGLEALSRRHGATLFMTLLAGFQALLARVTGSTDVVVGSPIAGRRRAELERLIGLFVNTLVLRTDLSGDPSFEELLGRARETALGAYVHQDLPFEKLVEGLSPERSLSHSPLFQVMLILQNARGAGPEPSPAATPAETLAPDWGTAKLDLTVELAPLGEGLLATLELNRDLFDETTVDRLWRAWLSLLEAATAAPGRRLSELPLLGAGERHQVLVEWNATALAASGTPLDRVLAQAWQRPDALAVAMAGEAMTYGELALRSSRVAEWLRGMGVGRGTLVGVTGERTVALPATLLGVWRAGGAYVPLDPAYPAERLAFMRQDAGLTTVLGSGETDAAAWRDARERTADGFERDATWPAPEDSAYVLYTSGSTGRPKGVEVSHAALLNFLEAMRRQPGFELTDRLVAVTSLSFDIAGLELYLPLLSGGRIELASREEAADGLALAGRLELDRATVLQATPATWRLLLAAGWEGDSRLTALCGGEALPAPLAAQLLPRVGALWNLYGPTETTVWSSVHAVGEASGGLVAIGRPIANTGLYVLDRTLRPVGPGTAGELFIGGAGVARGYLGRPRLTAERFLPDAWSAKAGRRLYRTGDVVRQRRDGTLDYLGRSDQQVKVRGHRIELGEIEAALEGLVGVRQAVVALREEVPGDPRLTAYVVAGEGGAPEPAELRRLLRSRLPEPMVPSAVVVLPALPLTPNGKVDRRALPPPGSEGASAKRAFTAPRTHLERVLADLWSDLLRLDRVGIEDDFFELGGHSLLATQLVFRIQKTFGVELPLRSLFSATTIAALAGVVEKLTSESGAAVEAFSLPPIEPAPGDRHLPFPLTDVQQAYWVGRSEVFELGGVATHLYFETDADGLDLDRFTIAWRRLVDRHDMLRAVFLPDGRQQVLASVPPYEITLLDLDGKDRDAVVEALDRIRREMSHQVLPTDRWPLFEVRATRTGERRLRLHVSIDFLIADAWSFRIINRELYHLYTTPEVELPPLGVSFRDYVLAEAAVRDTAAYRRSVDYWRRRLEELPPAPELPLARNPAAVAEPRFERRSNKLSRRGWRRLRELARQAGVTPSGALLAAYAEVLAAWSKGPRLSVNLTLFNRLPLHPQIGDLIGDFTSLTLLACEHRPGESFLGAARRLQEQLWSDLDHRWMSGVQVLRELARARRSSGALMPVVFTSTLGLDGSQEPEVDEAVPEPEVGELSYGISQTPQVWLDNQMYEAAGALYWNWDSLEGLFPPGMLDAMSDAYRGLLEELAGGEEAWSRTDRSLVPAAHREVQAAANRTGAVEPGRRLHELFFLRAAERGEAAAVIAADRSLSYRALAAGAVALADRLLAAGARPNRLVAIVMEKGWEQVVGALAILTSGAAYLPIDPALPEERFRRLLEQGEVELALTQAGLYDRLPWPAEVRRLVVDASDLDLAAVPAATPPRRQGLEALAYVLFTSGSTGVPKGVMIDHRGAANTIADVNRRFSVGGNDRVLALSSLGFDLSVYDLFGILAAGGTIVIPEPAAGRDPGRWCELVVEHGVTIWNSVPALLEMLVEYLAGRTDRPALPLRLALLSGDWIPVGLPGRLRALAPGTEVISLGGATEASIWSILHPVRDEDSRLPSIPYGRPMANQTFHVLDHGLSSRPVWVPGELYIGGVGLARGYWRDEERTRASFIARPTTGERLYRTGDLGRWLPDGEIEFLGREDTQVKVQGFRIELGEVEAALELHPAVRAGVAIAFGDPRGNRRLVAYVVAEGATEAIELAAPSDPSDLPRLLRPAPALPAPESAPAPLPKRLGTDLERLQHKLSEPGLRRDVAQLPYFELVGEVPPAAYERRRSVREWAPRPVAARQLSGLLSALLQIHPEGSALPRYRYPSAGSLYPVQVYLYVAAGAVSGVPGGLYYFHPAENRLLQLAAGVRLSPEMHAPVNRDLFARSSFSLFLIGRLAAITPIYPELGEGFCRLEAGYLSQLLMTVAPDHGLGLCPIGGLELDAARPGLALAAGDVFLHALVGGVLPEAAEPEGGAPPDLEIALVPGSAAAQGDGPAGRAGADAVSPARLSGELEKLQHKLSEPGLRRDLQDRPAIPLPRPPADPARLAAYEERRSVRQFRREPIPFADLDDLLASLASVHLDRFPLPKYLYPSAGNLYPVQVYLYVKPDRVAGVEEGIYYHHPRDRRLVLVAAGARVDRELYDAVNQPVFDESAFSIFLVARLAAIDPVYHQLARPFCQIEAGTMGQLLMTSAPSRSLGLCPIGSLDFAPLRPAFRLAADDLLVHSLLGGRVADAAGGAARQAAEAAWEAALEDEIRGFLRGKLPEYMVPSQVVVLDRLPLTANGKVDRRALPDPERRPARRSPVGGAAPATEHEQALAALLRELLAVSSLGVHDNFLDLGATSLHLVLLHRRLQSAFGRDVPVAELFNRPTVHALAQYLFGEDSGAALRAERERQADRLKAGRARQMQRRRQRDPAPGEAPSGDE